LKTKVEKAIQALRPYLQADGGDIELTDVDEEKGVVKVKLKGACHGSNGPNHTPTVSRTILEKENP
jgi:Fe-S cluster biogenesis protein NfuA